MCGNSKVPIEWLEGIAGQLVNENPMGNGFLFSPGRNCPVLRCISAEEYAWGRQDNAQHRDL